MTMQQYRAHAHVGVRVRTYQSLLDRYFSVDQRNRNLHIDVLELAVVVVPTS